MLTLILGESNSNVTVIAIRTYSYSTSIVKRIHFLKNKDTQISLSPITFQFLHSVLQNLRWHKTCLRKWKAIKYDYMSHIAGEALDFATPPTSSLSTLNPYFNYFPSVNPYKRKKLKYSSFECTKVPSYLTSYLLSSHVKNCDKQWKNCVGSDYTLVVRNVVKWMQTNGATVAVKISSFKYIIMYATSSDVNFLFLHVISECTFALHTYIPTI